MPRYAAFLRAVNVGRRRVKMDVLRNHMTAIGFENVQSYIASGNLIFDSSLRSLGKIERLIESHLEEELRFAVTAFVRTKRDVQTIAGNPHLVSEIGTVSVGLLKHVPSKETVQSLMSRANSKNMFEIDNREVYWRCLTSLLDSEFSNVDFEKVLQQEATFRKSTTVQAIATKLE